MKTTTIDTRRIASFVTAFAVLITLSTDFARAADQSDSDQIAKMLSGRNKTKSELIPPASQGNLKQLQNLAPPAATAGSSTKINAEGGMHGGGGNSVQVGNHLVLLDLYLAQLQQPSLRHDQPGLTLPVTPALEMLHMERLNRAENPIFQEAARRLSAWNKYSGTTKAIFQRALANAPLYYAPFDIAKKDPNFWIPDNLQATILPDSLTTVAMYLQGFGILISKPTFERLDYDSQVALLIHESLRHLSMSYFINMSSQTLQNLTSSIFYGTDFNTDDQAFLKSLTMLDEVSNLPQETADGISRAKTLISTLNNYPVMHSPLAHNYRAQLAQLNAQLDKLPNKPSMDQLNGISAKMMKLDATHEQFVKELQKRGHYDVKFEVLGPQFVVLVAQFNLLSVITFSQHVTVVIPNAIDSFYGVANELLNDNIDETDKNPEPNPFAAQTLDVYFSKLREANILK